MTLTVLVPVTKPVRPAMATLESASAVTAITATEVVPAATLTEPPSATEVPATVKVLRLVLLERAATTTVTV